MAPLVRTGGSRHTGLAALPHRNIQAADQIPAANYGHLEVPRPKQDVVPIDIVPDHIPEQHTASQMLNSNLDNPHTIEVSMKDITVRISNDADPVLLTRTFRMLQEFSC